tara:strand:+ start:385 stop:525 length:141 start_codon:yes stop_codon:yes gene_type:complete
MIPEFFQTQEQAFHFGLWRPIVGILIVFVGTCVGVEIRVGKDEEDT